MKRFLATLGVLIAGSAVPKAGNAAELLARDIAIPFEFKVEKVTLPAGHYRLQQTSGKSFVFIMNIQTGRGVQMMREGLNDPTTKTTLTFEKTEAGYKLSKVS
jgi:hypothetical protein